MTKSINKEKQTIKLTLIVLLTALFFYIFIKSLYIFLSAFIGIVISVQIQSFINCLEKKWNTPKLVSLIVLLILVFSIFFFVFYFSVELIVQQFEDLKDKIPIIIEKWNSTLKILNLNDFINKDSNQNLVQEGVKLVKSSIVSLLNALTGITIAAVIAIFTSINSLSYKHLLDNLTPEQNQNKLRDYLKIAEQTMKQWFKAQLTDMLIVGLLTAIGLAFVGINYWALFGILTGLLAFIPYFGTITVLIFSTLIVAVTQSDKLIWLWITFFIVQQLEGNFILPKIMKKHLNTPASLLIFFMILNGIWLGVLGVLVTPVLIAIIMKITFYNFNHNKNRK